MVETSGVRLDHVTFRIGGFILRDICLDVGEGEYFVLTGANGAGKTTLVKLIAGLKTPDSGDIFICGKSVTKIPPWKRNIGYVPQDYVLFPHRTVRANIAFGLEVRTVNKKQVEKEVDRTADLLGISDLLDRMPGELSGGEQQKVSSARALILKPSVLLLDEPVSSIDEDARDIMCRELKKIQREIRITTIHVSHNKMETELVADRIGHLTNGVIDKIASGCGGQQHFKSGEL